jgi:hypothetical protein
MDASYAHRRDSARLLYRPVIPPEQPQQIELHD